MAVVLTLQITIDRVLATAPIYRLANPHLRKGNHYTKLTGIPIDSFRMAGLRGQPAPTFQTPRLEYAAPTFSLHTRPEAMPTCPAPLLRLISSLRH